MRHMDRKGGILLKIIAAAALVLMIMAIETPRRMWKEQSARAELAHKKMEDMFNLSIIYTQETNKFSKDLKEVYEFATTYDTLKVSAPEVEIEILSLDSTGVRIAYSDRDHIKDLHVKTDAGVVLDGKSYDKLDFDTHKGFNGRTIEVSLELKDKNLTLESNKLTLTSNSEIKIVPYYRGDEDTYWDFTSDSKIDIDIQKAPPVQTVNMARYVLSDFNGDKTPYLCPSTLDPFNVNYNIGAKIKMLIMLYANETDKKGKPVNGLDFEGLADIEAKPLLSDENVTNYLLEIIHTRADLQVNRFVREHEVDGDSTYSNDNSKDSLYSIFFKDQLTDFNEKGAYIDSTEKNLYSIDYEQDKNFSKEKQYNLFMSVTPNQKMKDQKEKPEIKELLSLMKYKLKTGISELDTLSVKISSPINENSVFKGYDRGFFEKQKIFGIEDDKHHGHIDDGDKSWSEK